jgi:sterol desaturase/sphingolipid hydroxylase (fatty acid hydroxylase superfamily)
MHRIIDFLIYSSSEAQLIIITGMLLLCWNIELLAGFAVYKQKWKHAWVNARFIFSNFPLQVVVSLTFAFVLKWTSLHHFGFLYLLPQQVSRFWLFIISFLFLDLGEYAYHLVMHKIKPLWMFHLVHHCDLLPDTSTSLREHPGENLIRNTFTLLWVFISGTPFWCLVLRQSVQIISNVFAHTRYRLPEKVDKIVSLVFTTPNMHHVHHHFERPYTDSNFGDVLSIWDRFFGTFKHLSHSKLVFGIDAYMAEPSKKTYWYLLKLPFGKYRTTPRITNNTK